MNFSAAVTNTLRLSLAAGTVAALALAASATEPTKPADKPAAASPTAPAAAAARIKVGDTLPPITLTNAQGKPVALASLYATKPIVITMYRGGWCPYCATSLKAFQDRLAQADKLGASIVAISPERPEELAKTIAKGSLGYSVLSDSNGNAMHAMGLAFTLDDATQTKYRGYGINLAARNASGKWELPHPATLVVDTKGIVRYAYINEDFKTRATPDEVLAAVKKLQDEAAAAAAPATPKN